MPKQETTKQPLIINMAGIYIHIPFCASRCIYCGFYSSTGLLSEQDRYVTALLQEMRMRKEYLEGEPVETIYIGGGTPSLLSKTNLERIGKALYNKNTVKEFTIECNPDDVTVELCDTLTSIGVNRVSMGVQTFSDERLRFLHRRHDASHVYTAIDSLRKADIYNISIDLMFGFPNESMAEWEQDLDKAIGLEVQHISAYSLMYEEDTTLFNMREKGLIKENDEEQSVAMYDMLTEKLSAAAYEHYEISNFAKSGYRSLHNSSYWNGTNYLGLGAAAHSFNTKTRQWNVGNLAEYITAIEQGTIPMEQEVIDERTRYNDLITTALRTCEGVDLDGLNEYEKGYIMKNARKNIEAGMLEIKANKMKLTRQGLYISDEIMSDLIWI